MILIGIGGLYRDTHGARIAFRPAGHLYVLMGKMYAYHKQIELTLPQEWRGTFFTKKLGSLKNIKVTLR